MNNFWSNISAILASLGGGGIIVFCLSSWLGKIWANRLMESEKSRFAEDLARLESTLQSRNETKLNQLIHELEILKTKHLTAHNDKLTIYRYVVDLVSVFLADFADYSVGRIEKDKLLEQFHGFEVGRLKAYGYLAMLAPQKVMDAQDDFIDHLLLIINGKPFVWAKVREKALNCLNEIRKDIGIDVTPIKYNGSL